MFEKSLCVGYVITLTIKEDTNEVLFINNTAQNGGAIYAENAKLNISNNVVFGKLINDFGELLVAIGKDYENLENNL